MTQQNPSHNAAASSQSHSNTQSRLPSSHAQIARSTAATVVLKSGTHLHQLTTSAIAAEIGWAQGLCYLHCLRSSRVDSFDVKSARQINGKCWWRDGESALSSNGRIELGSRSEAPVNAYSCYGGISISTSGQHGPSMWCRTIPRERGPRSHGHGDVFCGTVFMLRRGEGNRFKNHAPTDP